MGRDPEQVDIEELAELVRNRRHDRELDFLPGDPGERELLAELVLALDDLRRRVEELEGREPMQRLGVECEACGHESEVVTMQCAACDSTRLRIVEL